MAIEVTLYTRRNCSLCDKAKAAIRRSAEEAGVQVELREIDIDTDSDLREQFTNDVPVIHIGGEEAFRHHVDPERLASILRGGEAKSDGSETLAAEKCVPCRGGVPPLRGAELEELRRQLRGEWRVVDEHHLEREFSFPDFAQALTFTNRVGAIAEEEGHHPDLYLSWGKVGVETWTHKIDGLTESDFILAAKIDKL